MSSDRHVRDYVESSDCVLMLGTFITDMNLGIYTAKLDRSRTILATSESIKVKYHQYADVEFTDYLTALSKSTLPRKRFKHPSPHVAPSPNARSILPPGTSPTGSPGSTRRERGETTGRRAPSTWTGAASPASARLS